jgi:SAM-dependent methyltransferase
VSTWRRQAPDAELLPKLKAWFDTGLGRQLVNEERALVKSALDGAFGHSLLELGLSGRTLTSCPEAIRRHYCLGPPLQRELGKNLDILTGYADLPIATESQDVVVVHHLLEFIANPHNMLRELERITVPHGKLLIVGFNPLSLLGLKLHVLGRLSSDSVWQQHWLTISRLEDWLGLLGFRVERRWYGFHRLPFSKPEWLTRPPPLEPESLRNLPMGGTFLLSATKYRVPVTPVRLRWMRDPMVNVRPLGAARQGIYKISE